MNFYETSAKENIEVTEMFLDIGGQAKLILHQGKEEIKGSEVGTSRNLINQSGSTQTKRRKCC